MFFIHGNADGVRLEHIAEMFRPKGGEIHGDMRPRSESRLAIFPNTTHVTLERISSSCSRNVTAVADVVEAFRGIKGVEGCPQE